MEDKISFFFHGENEILVTEIGNHKQKMAMWLTETHQIG